MSGHWTVTGKPVPHRMEYRSKRRVSTRLRISLDGVLLQSAGRVSAPRSLALPESSIRCRYFAPVPIRQCRFVCRLKLLHSKTASRFRWAPGLFGKARPPKMCSAKFSHKFRSQIRSSFFEDPSETYRPGRGQMLVPPYNHLHQ